MDASYFRKRYDENFKSLRVKREDEEAEKRKSRGKQRRCLGCGKVMKMNFYRCPSCIKGVDDYSTRIGYSM